ncbi:MAG: hypothetical protein AB1726_16735 [Planctomycetota bacterium]
MAGAGLAAAGRIVAFDAPFDRGFHTVLLDIETGEVRILDGAFAAAGTDPDLLLVHSASYDSFQLLDLQGTILREGLTIPGSKDRVVAVLDECTVLYDGWPTTGTVQEPFRGFRMVGPGSKWTIKIADLGAERFATVVPYVGHCDIAYGPFALD